MDSIVSEQISIKHLRLINYDVSVQLGSSIVELEVGSYWEAISSGCLKKDPEICRYGGKYIHDVWLIRNGAKWEDFLKLFLKGIVFIFNNGFHSNMFSNEAKLCSKVVRASFLTSWLLTF